MEWHSRKILAWRFSNPMESSICIEVVEEAIAKFGMLAIINTDQGSQFTSAAFTGLLKQHGIAISMDVCQSASTSMIAWANARGASCGKL
jgi:putative transposase